MENWKVGVWDGVVLMIGEFLLLFSFFLALKYGIW
jgi:hypothetical protein